MVARGTCANLTNARAPKGWPCIGRAGICWKSGSALAPLGDAAMPATYLRYWLRVGPPRLGMQTSSNPYDSCLHLPKVLSESGGLLGTLNPKP